MKLSKRPCDECGKPETEAKPFDDKWDVHEDCMPYKCPGPAFCEEWDCDYCNSL